MSWMPFTAVLARAPDSIRWRRRGDSRRRGFRSSTAEITFESTPGLEKLGKQLMDYPEKVIEIRLFTWYKGNQKDGYLELLKNRSRAIVDFLVKTGAKPDQIKEVDYTIENMEIYKGSDRDFNQEKPMEAHLLN
jgi:hypothetical protein